MLSARGMFGKEKKPKVLPGAVKNTEEKFNFTFTCGYALVAEAEQKAIQEQVPDLAEEIWKLHKADKNVIEMDDKSFDVYDKSISRVHD